MVWLVPDSLSLTMAYALQNSVLPPAYWTASWPVKSHRVRLILCPGLTRRTQGQVSVPWPLSKLARLERNPVFPATDTLPSGHEGETADTVTATRADN